MSEPTPTPTPTPTPEPPNLLTNPQFIRLDLFPAQITPDPTASGRPARVIVTDSYLTVFEEPTTPQSPQTTTPPSPSYALPLLDFYGSPLHGYTAVTDDGTFHISRAKGCGCGSRLRGIRPFPLAPYAPAPPKGPTP